MEDQDKKKAQEIAAAGKARMEAGDDTLRTGLEDIPVAMRLLVPCAAVGLRVEITHCRSCNYNIAVQELEGPKTDSKRTVVVCGAPRMLVAEKVITEVDHAG